MKFFNFSDSEELCKNVCFITVKDKDNEKILSVHAIRHEQNIEHITDYRYLSEEI
jgi:hypothetical protein